GTIQILPLAGHPNVGFVYSPGPVGRPQFSTAAFVQLRGVPLDPTPNAGVVHRQTALGHQFLNVTIRKRVSQIPSHRAHNDRWFQVPPSESRWPWFAHGTSLPESPPQLCNTSLSALLTWALFRSWVHFEVPLAIPTPKRTRYLR